MTMKLTRRMTTFAPLLFAAAAANAQTEDALTRQVDGRSFDDFIGVILRDYAVPGAVVAVADASGTIFAKGYGVRQAGLPDPVDENTRFQIASVSKFLTATAIATL